MTNNKLQGNVSTAVIAQKVVDAMHQSAFVQPVAVASRSLDKAKEFAEKHNIPVAYGSYEELLSDPNIDAVYIPVPTGIRTEWAIRAAKNNKHILCEKPIANAADVRRIIEVCREQNVLFMDNTMWLHHTRTRTLKNTVPMFGKNGSLQKIRASFNVNLKDMDPNNIRFSPDLEPYGALGDLGWYCIGNILFYYNYEKPFKMSIQSLRDSNGALVRCDGILCFSNDRIASFECSFIDCNRQDAEYLSRDQIIRISDFVLPIENEPFVVKRDNYNEVAYYYEGNTQYQTKRVDTDPCTQHVALFDTFARLAREPNSAEAKEWGQRTLHVMDVLDQIYQQCE